MKKTTEKKQQEARTRGWATIVYSESAPDNWVEILREIHVPALISPLHDSDIQSDGTPKKPHYHVQIMFDSNKSRRQAQRIFDQIHGVGILMLDCCRSYARYLCHLDDPDKALYDTNQVIALGGATYDKYVDDTSSSPAIIAEMIDYCNKTNEKYFCNLLDYARSNHEEWLKVLCHGGTFIMMNYLKSRCFKTRSDI